MERILKKCSAVLLSLTLSCTVAPLASSAASAAYDPCDVNRDGVVNISDVMYIGKYLNGKWSVEDPSVLDVNQNKIIDKLDQETVLAATVKNTPAVRFVDITSGENFVYTLPDTPLAEDEEMDAGLEPGIVSPDALSGPRTYYKLDCTTNTLTTYGLMTSVNAPAAAADSPDALEPMVSQDPFYAVNGNGMDGIVKISSIECNGTGFVVGDHVIATCAHNVYEDKNKDKALSSNEVYSNIKIQMCDTDGNLTKTTYTVKEVHFPKSYVQYASIMFDYALLTVSEDLSAYTHFNLGVLNPDTLNDMENVPIFVSGFPYHYGVYNRIYTSKGCSSDGFDSTEHMFYYTNRTESGMSGAPVYTVTDYYVNGVLQYRSNTVLAIHRGKYDGVPEAPAINSYLLKFYLDNDEIEY